jgi:pimeloyl-ACP methyl ester carboxylesterase
MNFDRPNDFYAAPVPSDDLLGSDGHISIDAFPNPRDIDIVKGAKALIGRDARGFAQAGAIFFELSGDLDAAKLPSMAESVKDTSPIFLVGVDSSSADFLHRYPVTVSFEKDGGPFGAPHLLSLLPLQGIPLRPGTRYAAVVLRRILDTGGKTLGRSASMATMGSGKLPPGMSPTAWTHYEAALKTLASHGVKMDDIAGLAVFTTDTPMASFDAVRKDALARPLPVPTAFTAMEVFDNFCVYKATIDLPEYQRGAAPYASEGGDWDVDDQNHPTFQRMETARVVVTVPRQAVPSSGFPTAVFIRCGGGGDRPLVDRGVQATTGGAARLPGTGPAMELARVGFAGISVDGPQGGLRNVTNGDEEFLMFNVQNPPALRDNVRQSAIETILVAHVLENLTVDASNCVGVTGGPAKFDVNRLALIGHSMGASIAPLAAAWEPRFKALVMSGAGASYIDNITDKKKPVEVKPLAEALLEYPSNTLTEHDPVLTLVQWAAEPSDSQVFARTIIQEPIEGSAPRHVLMEQGIVDNYIRPRIAAAISLSLGLDLGGTPLDTNPKLTPVELPLEQLLPYSGRKHVDLPATGNFVVQHAEDGIEDGHEVFFQTEPPKNQYRCFLKTFAAGAGPLVISDEGVCP